MCVQLIIEDMEQGCICNLTWPEVMQRIAETVGRLDIGEKLVIEQTVFDLIVTRVKKG